MNYLIIKQLHMLLAGLSILAFSARSIGAVLRARWPHQRAIALPVAGVNALLIAAGLWLWSHMAWTPMPWLTTKFVWLAGYLGLAWLALRPTLARPLRITAAVTALLCAIQVVAVARAHHPLGLFS